MTKECQQEIIIEYPEKFPITEALRAVFTERLQTLFNGCNIWACSVESSLPEKLFNLRLEMQKSIGYPPPWPDADMLQPEMQTIKTVIPPEVLLSWKDLQTKSIQDLPPAVRDAGLDLASKVLGVHIRYGQSTHLDVDNLPVDEGSFQSPFCKPSIPQALCPFTNPGVISELTKTWSAEDRAQLRHQIIGHSLIAVGVAFIVGMVLGAAITPSGNTTVITPPGYHAERSYLEPYRRHDDALTVRPLPSITPENAIGAANNAPGIITPKLGKGN